jgi:hypothetical protein
MRQYKLHQGPTADPYAELKAADKDPTKEIRCICCGSGEWYSSDSPYPWKWSFPPEAYEIRDKPNSKKVIQPMPQEHQSPEKFEMDAEFYPKRVAELEQQLAECQAREIALRDDMKLASVQYMGCGGNLLPKEVVDAMISILKRSLATPSDSTALDTLLEAARLKGMHEAGG